MLIKFDLLSSLLKTFALFDFPCFFRKICFQLMELLLVYFAIFANIFCLLSFRFELENRFFGKFFFLLSLKGQRKLIWRIQQKIILIKCCFFFRKKANEISSEKISFHEKVNKKVSVARLEGRRVYIRQRTVKPENFLSSRKRFSRWRSFLLISPHRSRRESLI